ncbi:MAG: six-hairpin glycosidase [Muribaculaceae bacterium]|nr:six-hairpin glycosidase [Muribaculaceae bacterium]
MNNFSRTLLSLGLVALASMASDAQDLIHYSGDKLSDPNRHDGGLSPVVGVHNIQTMRANRRYDLYDTNSNGWTYNHQPMMAWWNGKFYMHYLSNPVDEHVGAGRTLLQTSADGYTWSTPEILFPIYPLPDGYKKEGVDGEAKNHFAVMHQRVGFYVSKNGRLIAMGNYGICMNPKDDPNDGNGIGRVVREIYPDGRFGPIHFIYYNHGFNESNTLYPSFRRSKDKGFREACEEILANPLYRMQWVEEADRNDSIIPLKNPYKAFCWYTLPNGNIAALWKHALTSVSKDGGNTWLEPVERAVGFVNSNAKIWGQRLSDGTFATVYNPAEFRWPLAISLSSDGLDYTTLNLIHGEVPPMRYGGQYKSFGPQYVRGIQEGNGVPPDGDLWVTYSVGKEDMWVAHIPVPVQLTAIRHASAKDLDSCETLADLREWNIYSPVLAPVSMEVAKGAKWLRLADKDPFDVAKVERKIPPSRELIVEFDIMASQNDHGRLLIEFVDESGTACARLELTPDGIFRSKGGARYGKIISYNQGETYHVRVDISVRSRTSTVYVNGEKRSTRMLFAPVKEVERVVFRTGGHNNFPTVDTEPDQSDDMPRANDLDPEAIYRIRNLTTRSHDEDSTAAILRYDDFAHHAEYFNSVDDESIVQAIPNDEASEWMKANIPLFECPDRGIEEIYYFRWWTLRKHIKKTPVGWGMTEFLVPRSYADRYNLIACAIGHHIYESRWLRDQRWLNGIINTWYHGNEGTPMEKMMKFSSWNPDALYGRFLVNGDIARLSELYPDLCAEYVRWEESHRLPSGLYWQRDVSDGMEESISGARREHHARPSINSYMYGNARALASIATILEYDEESKNWALKADTLKRLIMENLWSDEDCFFETLRGDTVAHVREAIGYIPWYFNLPDSGVYERAWLQIEDPEGFSAPRGLTTAERRHPEFRTHGVGQCEWDGAIWPFATSQTLTALANYLNSTSSPIVSDSTYFAQFRLYTEAQHHRGYPYIGEYLDEVTGYWLKGDQERSRHYNHSTFCDLLITGLVGLRPRPDNVLEVKPLIPEGEWEWFCLDGVSYHGHNISILWDSDGSRYHRGPGLRVYVDGMEVGHSPSLSRLIIPGKL